MSSELNVCFADSCCEFFTNEKRIHTLKFVGKFHLKRRVQNLRHYYMVSDMDQLLLSVI